MQTFSRRCRLTLCAAALFAAFGISSTPSLFGYGPEGHQTVGAIADILIVGTHAEQEVRLLIGDETLEAASTWADRVKGGNLTSEMQAFVDRNPNHHHYHYTDIPIQEPAYRLNSAGANAEDVVQMIRKCIKVLQAPGPGPEAPITKKEALRLLVHYVGDIHQPLHVGSAYFDAQDHLVNLNDDPTASETHGGGWIKYRGNLHSFWDTQTVKNALAESTAGNPRNFAQRLTQTPPAGWRTTGAISGWSKRWATEILPDARGAHERLNIGPRHLTGGAQPHPAWPASAANNNEYQAWATGVVTKKLAQAGYRLAELLKRIWP